MVDTFEEINTLGKTLLTSTPLNREMVALEGIGTLERVALQSESTALRDPHP